MQFAGAGDDPALRLRACIDARLALGAGAAPEIVAAWVMIGAEAVRQLEVREAFQRAVVAELDLLTALMTACLRQNGRAGQDARALAAGVLALIEGACQLASAAGEIMPKGYAAEAAWRYALAAIAPGAGKP